MQKETGIVLKGITTRTKQRILSKDRVIMILAN
jgi:hypothetical protein